MVNKPSPFPCPECGAESRILETRQLKTHPEIRRRRECLKGHRFTTQEMVLINGSPQRKIAATKSALTKMRDELNQIMENLNE